MKKITYTDSGAKRLNKLHEELHNKIEQDIRDSKYNIGEDFIEVTASDVDDIGNRFRLIRRNKSSLIRPMVPFVTIALGIIISIYGIYYESIVQFIKEGNTFRILIVMYGFIMILMGIFYIFFLKIRKSREKASLEKIASRKLLDRMMS